MPESFSLPSGCVIRPAHPDDRPSIYQLLHQFRQEILPPPSPVNVLLRALAIAFLGIAGTYVTLAIGWQQVLNLLVGPGAVIGLAIALTLLLTWNSNWQNFWVTEYNHQIIGCAKLRRCHQYSLLHDLYIVPEWRSRGLGSYFVLFLGRQATKPLYLTCLPKLTKFYLRLGFTPIAPQSLSPLIQYDLGIATGQFEVVPLVLR